MSGQPVTNPTRERYARWALFFPLWVWGIQLITLILFRDRHGPLIGIAHLLAAVAQLVLLLAGLVLGIWLLLSGKSQLSRSARTAARIGTALTLATIALIIAAMLISLMR